MEIQANWISEFNFAWKSEGPVPNPYEWFLFSLASSTGIEMLNHFKEHHTTIESLSITVKGNLISKYQTKVFNTIDVFINSETKDDKVKILNALEYSQYRASGISAMVSKLMPVRWVLNVNNEMVGEGIAQFEELNENQY